MKACLTLVALAALVALPVSAEITGSILFTAGLVLIAKADYGRRFRPLATEARGAPACRQDLRLAA